MVTDGRPVLLFVCSSFFPRLFCFFPSQHWFVFDLLWFRCNFVSFRSLFFTLCTVSVRSRNGRRRLHFVDNFMCTSSVCSISLHRLVGFCFVFSVSLEIRLILRKEQKTFNLGSQMHKTLVFFSTLLLNRSEDNEKSSVPLTMWTKCNVNIRVSVALDASKRRSLLLFKALWMCYAGEEVSHGNCEAACFEFFFRCSSACLDPGNDPKWMKMNIKNKKMRQNGTTTTKNEPRKKYQVLNFCLTVLIDMHSFLRPTLIPKANWSQHERMYRSSDKKKRQ